MITKQIPKGGEVLYGHSINLPDNYDPAKEYPLIVFIHGIGECSAGSLYNVTNVFNWVKNNSFLLTAVDRGFIVVLPTYLNTTAEKSKVCQWTLQHIKSKYKIRQDLVAFVGHSNGSHTLGTWGFSDAVFARQVAIWVCSASGPFSAAATFQNIANYDVRVWGVTALNDSVISPTYVTQLGTKVPALNPKATVIITKFPATRFPDGRTAHNVVLGQITKTPLPFVSMGDITDRLGSTPKMDLYEWILSNPRGSIPQLPDGTYIGPKYVDQPPPVEPEPDPVEPPPPPPPPVTPTTKRVRGVSYAGVKAMEIFYDDGSIESFVVPTGDTALNVYNSHVHDIITIKLMNGGIKIFPSNL